MSNVKEKCCAVIYNGMFSGRCNKTAKVECNGKHFCGMHDPQKQIDRCAKLRAKMASERDESNKRAKEAGLVRMKAEMFHDLISVLRVIAEQDPVELALDPQWSQRIAKSGMNTCLAAISIYEETK